MNKLILAIALLIITNVSISIAFVISDNESELLTEKAFHLEQKVTHLRNHILQQNSHLSFQELRNKLNIRGELSEYERHTGNIAYSGVYFVFKDGKLIEIE